MGRVGWRAVRPGRHRAAQAAAGTSTQNRDRRMSTIRHGRQRPPARTAFPQQTQTIAMTDIATRSTKMYLIQEDLARAHIRKLQDEAAAERVARGLLRVPKAASQADRGPPPVSQRIAARAVAIRPPPRPPAPTRAGGLPYRARFSLPSGRRGRGGSFPTRPASARWPPTGRGRRPRPSRPDGSADMRVAGWAEGRGGRQAAGGGRPSLLGGAARPD